MNKLAKIGIISGIGIAIFLFLKRKSASAAGISAQPAAANALSAMDQSLPAIKNAPADIQQAIVAAKTAIASVQNVSSGNTIAPSTISQALPTIQAAITAIKNAPTEIQNGLSTVKDTLTTLQNGYKAVQSTIQSVASTPTTDPLSTIPQSPAVIQPKLATEQDLIHLPGTVHTYVGESNGPGDNSIDGDPSTFQGEGKIGQDIGNGNFSRTCISQHTWTTPKTVNSITYKMRTQAATAGVQSDSFEYDQKIEYTTDGSTWITVNGTRKNRSGGANQTWSQAFNWGIITQDNTITVNLPGCLGIRAYTYTHVTENDGHLWAGNEIYEIAAIGI